MNNILEDLITLSYEPEAPYNDIVIRIDGRKLYMLQMLDGGNNDFTYNYNNLNIKSTLLYIISIVDRANRMHIKTAEDIIFRKVNNMISSERQVSDEDLKKLNADILALRELIND